MNRLKKKYLFIIIAIATLTSLSLIPIMVFVIRLPRENFRILKAIKVKTDTKIRLSYRYLHSVEHTRVEGKFCIGPDGNLRILETRMASVGTGLPNDVPERSHREKESLVVDEKQQIVNYLSFYIVPINKTRLYVDNQEIPISHLQAGALIHMDVEKIRLYNWIVWRITGFGWRKEKN